jgi:hypothetical protein
MFEDQTVELLPARTTMKKWGNGKRNNNKTTNVAVNVIGDVSQEVEGDKNHVKLTIIQVAAAGNS